MKTLPVQLEVRIDMPAARAREIANAWVALADQLEAAEAIDNAADDDTPDSDPTNPTGTVRTNNRNPVL